MKSTISQRLKHLFVVFLFLIGLIVAGYQCPIFYFTGVPCPGCGMTRAWMNALHLNWKQAFSYHPLFLTVPVIAIILFFQNEIPKKVLYGLMIFFLILYLVVYIYRIFLYPNSLVYIDFKNSFVVRCLGL